MNKRNWGQHRKGTQYGGIRRLYAAMKATGLRCALRATLARYSHRHRWRPLAKIAIRRQCGERRDGARILFKRPKEPLHFIFARNRYRSALSDSCGIYLPDR
mgnify:CR=1 FL=1